MPVSNVLLIVEVLAPLNQVVDLVVKVTVVQLHKPLVVEGVLIQLLKGQFVQILCDLRLFLDQLSIFSIFVELAEPF